MLAAAPPEIDDPHPLHDDRLDVGARLGWLLRTWRLATPADPAAPALPTGAEDDEAAGVRDGIVVDAYERALGRPHGALRTPIDVLCRTFPSAPADRDPWRPPDSLTDFSEACARVERGGDGHDWLRFAQHHAHGRFGLTEALVRPAVQRLAGEVGRAGGLGYQLRYEALAMLRCSAYGDVVVDAARHLVARPGVQVVNDLVSAVTEEPTAEMARWCGELLDDASDVVVVGACLGLQNLAVAERLTPGDWDAVVEPLARARERPGGSRRRSVLAETVAVLPAAVTAAVEARRPGPQRHAAPRAVPPGGDATGHYAFAVELARTAAAGRHGERLLARLLFEVVYDVRAARAVTSGFLLAASVFAAEVTTLLGRAALDGPDDATRHGAARALANLMLPAPGMDLDAWLAHPDPVVRSAGLTICGYTGYRIPEPTLRAIVARGDDELRPALMAAGLSGHPALTRLAQDPSLPAATRAAASWWRNAGPRVVR